MTDDPPPDAIPAATLVILRDTAAAPELLMVERAKAMAFAGGAMVFPGGRIDPGDHALAAMLSGDADEAGGADEAAARIAAIRETIEEAGVPVGVVPMPDADTLIRLRDALHTGTPFGAALADAGLALDLDALVPFARWRPAHARSRIFDTRFYLARLPDGAPEARVDTTENVRLLWAGAQTILDAADAGRMQVIFPTRRNLERLAQFADHDAAVAQARSIPVATITPWTETRDGEAHLCIPVDAGYPVTSQRLTDAVRG